ncbi:MAG: SLC13 family permease [Planctomycetota bacterium]
MMLSPILLQTDAPGHPDVPLAVTLLFGGVLLAMIGCLAFEEKLHARKSIITGAFAAISLLLGTAFDLLPFGPVTVGGHALDLPVYVPGIDWNVIAIILGSSLFVDVASKSGLFTWVAIRLTKASGGDPLRLLLFYGCMTVLFSAVLNNVTAMIIVGSLTVVSLDRLSRRDLLLGFLLTEGLLTNIGGLLTLISSVPNIIAGTAAGISFAKFFLVASPFVLVTTFATILMAARIFRIRKLTDQKARDEARTMVVGFEENDGIESRWFFWFGSIMLVAFIGTIATASVLPWIKDLGLGYVALFFGLVMLVRYKATAEKFYQAIDWDLLGFFASLFVIINVMEYAEVLSLIGSGLEKVIAQGELAGSGLTLILSAAASSVTDNIPLTAMLAKIMGADPEIGPNPDSPFWWSVIFGANLGGNLTPIGSASTLVAVTIIHKEKLRMSFASFCKAALPFALVQIVLATAYLLLFLR